MTRSVVLTEGSTILRTVSIWLNSCVNRVFR